MKISFISVMHGAPWGGSERLWSDTALRLCQSGHSVSASITYWPNPNAAVQALRAAGCRVFERKRDRSLSVTLKMLGKNPEFWRAERFIKAESPDLVVISCGGMFEDLWWAQACYENNVPYVMISQAAAEMWWPQDDQLAAIQTAYQRARQIFFVARRNLKLVERMLGREIPNASVVWNPFNVEYAAVCPYPAAGPPFNFASVGRLEVYAKGQDLLLEVLSLGKWKSRGIEVSFYGSGVNADSLKALCRFYGLNNVVFQGHATDVLEIWKRNHILILPSRLEGLPLVLVEAMLCGRAAIVTDVAGNTEVVDDNETGFVAASPTVAHIDEAMERAWERRSEWMEMGREAARRIRLAVPRDPVGVFTDELLKLMKA